MATATANTVTRLSISSLKALCKSPAEGNFFFTRKSSKDDKKRWACTRPEGRYILVWQQTKGSGNYMLDSFAIYRFNPNDKGLDYVGGAQFRTWEDAKAWLTAERLEGKTTTGGMLTSNVRNMLVNPTPDVERNRSLLTDFLGFMETFTTHSVPDAVRGNVNAWASRFLALAEDNRNSPEFTASCKWTAAHLVPEVL